MMENRKLFKLTFLVETQISSARDLHFRKNTNRVTSF